jgi:chromosome partitioning protein
MRIAAVSTKGGTGKTTTAVYLATMLHRQGRTLGIDADGNTASLTAWSVGLPFTVVSRALPDLHKIMADLAADYEHVMIDTPPGDGAVIRSAVMASRVVIVPVSPTGLDLDRLAPTFEILNELAPTHPDLSVGILLTRVRARTRARVEARSKLIEFGYPVLDTEIPLLELYSGTFGACPADFGAYGDLLLELT